MERLLRFHFPIQPGRLADSGWGCHVPPASWGAFRGSHLSTPGRTRSFASRLLKQHFEVAAGDRGAEFELACEGERRLLRMLEGGVGVVHFQLNEAPELVDLVKRHFEIDVRVPDVPDGPSLADGGDGSKTEFQQTGSALLGTFGRHGELDFPARLGVSAQLGTFVRHAICRVVPPDPERLVGLSEIAARVIEVLILLRRHPNLRATQSSQALFTLKTVLDSGFQFDFVHGVGGSHPKGGFNGESRAEGEHDGWALGTAPLERFQNEQHGR